MSNNSQVTHHGAWGAPPIPKKPPPWQEANKPPAAPQRKLGDILREFGENTTAHGVPRIALSKRPVTKTFWLAVFLAMLFIFCWQGTEVLVEYLGYPSTTKVKLVTNPELTFPAVTICNMNRLRRSKLAGTRFDGLIRLDGGLTDDGGNTDYSWWFDWDSAWYDQYLETYSGSPQSVSSQSGGAWVPDESVGTIGTPDPTDTEIEAETPTAAPPAFSPPGETSPSASDGMAEVRTSVPPGSSAEVFTTYGDEIGDEDVTGTGTGAGWDGTAITPEEYTLDAVTASGAANTALDTATSEEEVTTLSVADKSGSPLWTASVFEYDVTTLPVMTSESRDKTTTDGTSGFDTTAGATDPSTSAFGASVDTPTSDAWPTPVMTSSGIEDGVTASAPLSEAPINTEPPPAMTTTTTTELGTEPPPPPPPPGPNATAAQPPDPTSAGPARRKKRSLRQIRDAGTDTSVGDIMDAVGEFGSWVDQQWNNGDEEHDRFDFNYVEYFDWGDVDDPNDWPLFYELSTAPDYSDFIDIVNPTQEEFKTLGHQAKDMILQCTFDKKLCSYSDFHQFQNNEYGNCFTFNHGQDQTAVNNTKNSGAQFGLHLTLFLEMPEYVGILSPEAGVRVAVHPHTTQPFPEDDGITASPGMATNVGLRQVYVERLGRPHNIEDCRPYTPTTYSQKACHRMCVQEEMYKRCQCVSDILLENKTKCSYIDVSQQKCRQLVKYLGEQKKLNCDCPVACNETTYTKAVSSTHWPSERYEEHLQRRLQEDPDSAFAARMATSEERTNKNLVRLRVYFEELNYQSILEKPLYTFPNLLGNVGGLLGLYIGVSFLTLAEVAALIFHIFKYLCRKAFVRDVAPTPIA